MKNKYAGWKVEITKTESVKTHEVSSMKTEDHINVIYEDAFRMIEESKVYLNAVKNLQVEAAKRGLSGTSVIINAKNVTEKCRNDLHLLSSSVQLTQNF